MINNILYFLIIAKYYKNISDNELPNDMSFSYLYIWLMNWKLKSSSFNIIFDILIIS